LNAVLIYFNCEEFFDYMLFGGPKKTEEIEISKLIKFNESTFEFKIKKSAASYATIEGSIDDELEKFESACKELGSFEGEPDTEFIGRASISMLKSQKQIYANALIGIAKSFTHEQKSNTYDSMVAASSGLHSMLKRMLETNSKFKAVVMVYSNQMQKLKRLYSNIESLVNSLDAEIAKIEPKAEEYNEINTLASKLEVLAEEYSKPSKQEIKASIDYPYVIKLLEDALAKKENETSNIEKLIESEKAYITSVLAPLERAARKHDHMNNTTLYSFVSNPIEMINKQNYMEFKKGMEKLYEEIHTGKIDEHSSAIDSAIIKATDPQILEKVENERNLTKRYMHNLRNIAEMKARLSDYKVMAVKSNELAESIKSDAEKRKELLAAIIQLKQKIEKLYESYYGIRIEIKLNLGS
jgi:hypothetical protein